MVVALYSVVFAAVHLAANLLGWYLIYSWMDIVMHIGGGIWVAWVLWAYRPTVIAKLPLRWQALGILSAVALVGVGWEFLEAGADMYQLLERGYTWSALPDGFTIDPFYNRWDTLLDLFNDLLGGVLVVLVGVIQAARSRR